MSGNSVYNYSFMSNSQQILIVSTGKFALKLVKNVLI